MAVYPQVVLPDPIFLQSESYNAQSDRLPMQELVGAQGVGGRPDFKISLVSGRTVRTAAGVAHILGRNVPEQGMYRLGTTTTYDVTHNAGDGSNPRIDQVILRVMDNAHDSSGFNETRMEAVPGNPTSGATLDNRTGALNLDSLGEASKNTLLLADVLVPAGATTINASDIRDRRTFYGPTIPNLLADSLIDFCPIRPFLPIVNGDVGGGSDLHQVAVPFWLPRDITTDGMRWAYRQDGTTALTGNYVFAIADASGRVVLQTASTAFAGATNTRQRPDVNWTAGDVLLRAGQYWAFFGLDSTNSGSIRTYACVCNVGIDSSFLPYVGGFIYRNTGGVTVPTTLLVLGDPAGINTISVPHFALIRST